MAVCPWCGTKVEGGFFTGQTTYCYCTSLQNPGVNKKGDTSDIGVAWARCVEGEAVQGFDFKQCPFFKKKTATRK